MSMLAELSKLRYHGPQALRCRYCQAAFEDGMVIEGPTRDRQNTGKPKEYWHSNCSNPWPTNVNNIKGQQIITNSNGSAQGAWNRAAPPAIAPPSTAYINEASPIEPAPPAADAVAAILAAIKTSLVPQITAITDGLDSRINTVSNVLTELNAKAASRIDTTNARIDSTIEQLDKLGKLITDLQKQQPIIVQINRADGTPVLKDVGRQHFMFKELLDLVAANSNNIWLTGPAGSGKSTAAEVVAQALDRPFDIVPIVSDPIELMGYQDANGNYVPTNFFRRYTEGGILCLDEIDGWDARAGLVANGALANGHAAFPHGTYKRHPDCTIIATANTWGFGGDADYVGRTKLDKTTLDRFDTLPWEYDSAFERALAGYGTDSTIDAYIDAVQAARALALQARAQVQITPRASINGSRLLRAGMSKAAVMRARFSRDRAHNMWPTVGKPLEDWATAD